MVSLYYFCTPNEKGDTGKRVLAQVLIDTGEKFSGQYFRK